MAKVSSNRPSALRSGGGKSSWPSPNATKTASKTPGWKPATEKTVDSKSATSTTVRSGGGKNSAMYPKPK